MQLFGTQSWCLHTHCSLVYCGIFCIYTLFVISLADFLAVYRISICDYVS